MLAPMVLIEPCDGVVLSPEDSFGHESMVVCSDRVKLVREAEFHQATSILKKSLMQIQSNMRPRCELANSMAIHVETPQELNHVGRFRCRLVLVFLSCIMLVYETPSAYLPRPNCQTNRLPNRPFHCGAALNDGDAVVASFADEHFQLPIRPGWIAVLSQE